MTDDLMDTLYKIAELQRDMYKRPCTICGAPSTEQALGEPLCLPCWQMIDADLSMEVLHDYQSPP